MTAQPTSLPLHRVLLARLEADQAKVERNAPLCRTDEVRWVNEGMAAAHRADCAHLLAVFEGPEAAAEYMRQGGTRDELASPDATSEDGLREQYAAAIRALNVGGTLADLDEDDDVYALTRAVLAVRDLHVEQLASRVAELEQRVAEDAEDYAELADHTEATCEAVQRRDAAEAAVERVRAECDAMEQAMANGHASLSRLREHIGRIRDALEGVVAERAEGAR